MTDNELVNRVEQIITSRAGVGDMDHYYYDNGIHFAVVDGEEFFALKELSFGWKATGYFGTADGFGKTISEAVQNCMNNYRIYVKGF